MTDIKLKANCDILDTSDKVIKEVGLTVSVPTLLQVNPSATVIGDGALCGWKLEKILGLPIMWFVTPESIMIHLFEEVPRHALSDLA